MHKKSEYINRLKTVSFQEFSYRIKRWVQTQYVEKKFKRNKKFIKVPNIDSNHFETIEPPTIKMEGPVNGRDFKTGHFEKHHRQFLSSKIKIHHQAPDIRSLWESGRLQGVSNILFSEGQDSRLSQAKKNIMSWIRDNPFLHGVHYMSPMECGLRIPVFFYLLKANGIHWENTERQSVETILYYHTWWVSKNLALYSSLGNHTICECIGLVFGGAVFKESIQGKKWLDTGSRLLEQELTHQILPDGGPAEQSLNYHRFVLDLYWLAVDFLESNHFHDCSTWKNRLKKGENFLGSFSFTDNGFPQLGDSDDGHAIGPGLIPKRQIKTLHHNAPPDKLSHKTFQAAGYTLIRDSNSVFITLDHGPLGMGPLYNHGHADANSITLYKNGTPFLIDPGTYRYNGVPEQRAYFKGTRAHNTVCIDGRDQAQQLSGFIWAHPYNAGLDNLDHSPDKISIRTHHDGYRRLKAPVIHHRELSIFSDICCVIVDYFSGKGVHEFELNYHLDPGVEVRFENDWLACRNSGESIFFYTPKNCLSVISGQKEPLLGWYSPQYGMMQKTNTIQNATTGSPKKIRFLTLICFDEAHFNTAIQIQKDIMENQCNGILC